MSLVFQINQATARLEAAQANLKQATQNYANIKALRGQDGYAITIGGIKIDVAVNGGPQGAWMAKLVRGRDMMHLGALKALDSEIDACRAQIKQCSLDLATLAEKLAKAADGWSA